MVHKTLESVYSDKCFVIPMADVQHIEKEYHTHDLVDGTKEGDFLGIIIITKHTRWDMEADTWANNIWLPAKNALKFLEAWYLYRHKLESI